MSAGRKIYDFAMDMLDNEECVYCGSNLEVYVGDNYYDGRVKNCGNIICNECESGIVVTEGGLMYYFEKGIFKYGGNDKGLGQELFDKIYEY